MENDKMTELEEAELDSIAGGVPPLPPPKFLPPKMSNGDSAGTAGGTISGTVMK
jgi:hypothetical protein